MKAYDFYYSRSHDSHLKKIEKHTREKMPETFVNGIKYTEMIEKTLGPLSQKHFGDDLKKVYSGKENEFKITYR